MRIVTLAACCVLLSTSAVFAAHQMTNDRIAITFHADGPQQTADIVDSVTWVKSDRTTTSNLAMQSDGSLTHCGEPGEFFGQSYGDSEGSGLRMVTEAASSEWTSKSATSGVSRISSPPPSIQCGELSGRTTTTYTLGVSKAAISEMKITRVFKFDAVGAQQKEGLRAYVPRVDRQKYSTVLYPDKAGSVQIADFAHCARACPIDDWNGVWVADEDDQGNGIVLIRDTSSKWPAEIAVDYDTGSSSNATSILLMLPATGWTGTLTETEWLCFYDATSWPKAQRDTGNQLPAGCERRS